MWNYSKYPGVVWECNVFVPKDQELPPIHELLELLCYGIKWSPTHSIFKLFLILCLPKMGLWEITRTSLYRANHKELQDLICHYAEEGQPIKLAALLCFLPVEFFCFSSDFDGSAESLSTYVERKETEWLTRIEALRGRISGKILSLIVEERKLMGSGSSDLAQICKKKKMLMMSVMLLIEIYERFGDDIGFCVTGANGMTLEQSKRMANILVDKLKESGFPVKNEFFEVFKHLNCDERQPKVAGGACGSKFEQKDPKIPVYKKIQSPPITKQTNGMPLGQQRRPISTHSLQEKPGLLSMVQSNYMSQRFTTKFSRKFCTATEAQIRRPVPGLAQCKKLSSFLSVIKRGI
ncbi:uncharacterized protein LOC132276690 isoform X2 [Cornus florida]|uniref:uncharacterized protein LOC132276690 isoform X2 n=1 Tax=Cornus florida TaxID=4283 RepID=UPI00289D6506|nr:uncharacterized protein LOC132276690 isoform X2 [Cornus florida]